MTASAPRIVVVDDEAAIGTYLSGVLSMEGYDCTCFQESLAALAYLSQNHPPPDLLMTDICMPGMGGLELLRQVHRLAPGLPVVLISGLYELATALEAVRSGAADYLLKPAKPSEVIDMVARHVNPASPEPAAVHEAITDFLAHYKPQLHKLPAEQLDAAKLFQALGFRRYETMQHSLRVSSYAVLLGRAYGLTSPQLRELELGALLHDIGKIAIPRNVILKPGPLNANEWRVMHTHPVIGHKLLADLPGMEGVAEIVHCHHESWDGQGYPRGLRGEEIPVAARLFSVVDTIDAITCNRPYRQARPFSVARQELERCRGSQFDPHAVDVFLSLPEAALTAIRDRLPDTE